MKFFVIFSVICLSFEMIVAQPTITGLSPQSGPIGTTVTITGTNFGGYTTNNIVYFGAVKATVLTATSTSLTVTVPKGASYQPVSVTTNSLTAYSRLPFIVTFAGGGSALAPSSMAAKTDLSADSLTSAIFISDLDGDGKADLLAVNEYSNTLSIFKNNSSTGSLSFSPKTDIATGNNPLWVVAGDLDGDSLPDIVVVNNSSNTISIYKNGSAPGYISFYPRVDLPTGTGPDAVTMADLDGDGRPELIVSNGTNYSISVFKNTTGAGPISFGAKQDFVVGYNAQDVTAADLDGDGKPELITANGAGSSVSVFQNTSAAGIISLAPKIDFPITGFPYVVSVGDLDGDGNPDLVIATGAGPGVYIMKNMSSPGSISFPSAATSIFGSLPSFAVAISDVDGDGLPDITSVNSNISGFNNSVSVFRNISSAGSILFEPRVNYTVGTNPWLAATSDLDGDGMPEIITANSGAHSVSVLRNTVSPLAIFSFTPVIAKKDDIVNITGKGFTAITSVSFGGVPADSFSVISSTNIVAYPGPGASGSISISTASATASIGGFTFIPAPNISSFTPTTGGPGAIVTITGTNFSGIDSVSFGGVPATSFTVQSPTTITAVVAAGASGNVNVHGSGGTSFKSGFIFNSTPTISGYSPDPAGIGSTVTIVGTNFLGASSVSFGGVAASSFTVISYDTIRAIVGNAANGNVSVTTAGGTATAAGFIFNSTPVITSFSPGTGGDGSVITIVGQFFLGATAVSFGGIPATSFVVHSRDTITAVVGNGAAGNISVTTSYGTGQSGGFLFTSQPAVSDFAPTAGAKGTLVTIHGINLNGTTSVSFGGTSAPFTIISASELTAIVPLDSTGIVSITVASPLGTITLNGFYFKPINIFSISPLSGPVGSTVTITGSNFSSIPSHNKVFFGAAQAYVMSAGSGSLTVTVPSGATYKPITVTNMDDHLTAYASQYFIVTFNGEPDFNANSFVNAGTLTGGDYPSYLFLSDLDGDGKTDLIVDNIHGQSFSVFKNASTNGTITFAPKIDFSTGLSPYGVVVADVNGDGKPDVVVANYSDNNIGVYKNTSTGGTISFDAPVTCTLTRSPYEVTVGDLNGDGKPDLAVAVFGSPAVAVFRNTGTGGNISFAPAVSFNAGGSSSNIVMGDLDGDGKPDLAMSTYGDALVSVLQNTSNQDIISFAPVKVFAVPGRPTSIDIGDLDGDGMPDLASSSDLAAVLTTYRNTSSNGFVSLEPGLNYSTGIYTNDVAIGDLNGDGKPDMVSANNQVSAVSVFRNQSQNGMISFSGRTDFNAGNSPQNIVIGDLDGDGKPDMAVTNYVVNTITLLRNTENDSISPKIVSFSPDSGVVGTSITITGNHFTGTSAVSVGGVPAATYSVNSDSSITAIVGKGASGDVAVTTPDGTAAKSEFQYILSEADSVFSLIQFSGALVNTSVQLEWKTSFEKYIAKYIVEYSTDGLLFSAIDSLDKSGTGSYQYNDTRKLDSNNFYRLKIVDSAGNFVWSDVVFIHIPVATTPPTGSNGLVLNPNPAHGSIVISLPATSSVSSLTIINMMGKQVQSISLPPNTSQVTVDLSTLQPGIYIVVWRNGSQVYKQSLLVE